jgi:hypothetical protein
LEVHQVLGQRGLEGDLLAATGVVKTQSPSVESLSGQSKTRASHDWEGASAFLAGIDSLSEQGVAVKGGLDPDLIPLPSHEPNLEERGDGSVAFADAVVADRRLNGSLNGSFAPPLGRATGQRGGFPHQPRSRW